MPVWVVGSNSTYGSVDWAVGKTVELARKTLQAPELVGVVWLDPGLQPQGAPQSPLD